MRSEENGWLSGSGPEPLAKGGWFPESFDEHRGDIQFVATDRDALASQTFLDWRWDRTGRSRTRSSIASLAAQLPSQLPQAAVIWHTGFCCSTLLAKALDCPGRNLSLCEPQILVEIANAGRAGLLAGESMGRISQVVFALLSRGTERGERVTLKPAPAANILLRTEPFRAAAPMLVLYSDCRSFLVSVAKLGEAGRKYVRSAFVAMLRDGHPQAKWPPKNLVAMSDLELAATVWHMQIGEIRRNWPDLRNAVSLDCKAFLEFPIEALNLVDKFFALSLGQSHIEQAVAGPLFRRNAKTGEEAFDAARRQSEHRRIAKELGSDLERMVAESYELCPMTPRGTPLPNSLLPCA